MARPNGSGSAASRETPDEQRSEKRSAQDAAALASYISDMASELAHLAGSAQMPMLAYFLSLAQVEAEMLARQTGGIEIQREN